MGYFLYGTINVPGNKNIERFRCFFTNFRLASSLKFKLMIDEILAGSQVGAEQRGSGRRV